MAEAPETSAAIYCMAGWLAWGQEGQVYLRLLITLRPIGCKLEDASEQPVVALCLQGGQAVEATAGEVPCPTRAAPS